MVNYTRIFWSSLGILLLLNSGQSDPLRNVNLAPFWQWLSAYECMQNASAQCGGNNINLAGVVVVNNTELDNYCGNGGCLWHTQHVLKCISLVHRHFWFANGLTVQDMNDTITDGCAHDKEINTAGIKKSSGVKTYQSLLIPLVSSLATLIMITMFNK